MIAARALHAAVALLALCAGEAAVAQQHSTCPAIPTPAQFGPLDRMTVAVRKIGRDRVLALEGAIDANTPALVARAIADNPGVAEIWLRSPGGHAAAGNATAAIIRKSGLPVRVPSGWWCISACNFLFFGGAIRMIDPGGQFAVHMATTVNDERYQARVGELAKRGAKEGVLEEIARREQSTAILTADDIDVILRMGISRKLLSEVMYAQRADAFRDGRAIDGPVETYRCLTRAEMVRYNVVNTD